MQKLKIEKLEKEIKELKEIKEKYYILLKQQNLAFEEKEILLDNEVNIKYCIFDEDYSIKCNKFIKISQFKKILQDKHELNIEIMLIFCGIEMDDNILLNDFPLQEYKEEKIYIRDLSYKLSAFNQTKIIIENTEIVFYGVNTFKLLQKYVNIYFNNKIIFYDLYNKMELYKEFAGKYFKDIRCFKIKTISNFSKIKINVNDKYPLEVNRYADKNSLIYYLADKFNYNYDKEIFIPFFYYESEIEFNCLKELNIIDGASVSFYLIPSKQYLEKTIKENKNFFIYIKNNFSPKITQLKVCGCLRVFDLKVLYQLKEGTPFVINRLIYEGRQLEEKRTLEDYGIKDESILQSILRLRGG